MRRLRLKDFTNEFANAWQVTTQILSQLDKQRGQLNKIASEILIDTTKFYSETHQTSSKRECFRNQSLTISIVNIATSELNSLITSTMGLLQTQATDNLNQVLTVTQFASQRR
jgi:hypothetical protein